VFKPRHKFRFVTDSTLLAFRLTLVKNISSGPIHMPKTFNLAASVRLCCRCSRSNIILLIVIRAQGARSACQSAYDLFLFVPIGIVGSQCTVSEAR
jgi:hypothetical protein